MESPNWQYIKVVYTANWVIIYIYRLPPIKGTIETAIDFGWTNCWAEEEQSLSGSTRAAKVTFDGRGPVGSSQAGHLIHKKKPGFADQKTLGL